MRKIIISVLGTAVILTFMFLLIFRGIVPVSSDKVSFEISAGDYESEEIYCDENGNETKKTVTRQDVNLNFTIDCKCVRFKSEPEYIYNPDGSITAHHDLWIYSVVNLPFDSRGEHPNEFEFGGYVHEGDTLTIHCADKTEEYDLYQMYLENKQD